MAQYFYGADGLVQAITASSSQMSYSMANSAILNAYSTAGMEGVKALAGDYGVSYVALADKVTPAWWCVGGTEGATATSAEVLYPAVLDSTLDTVNDKVIFETAKQVTTQGGGKIFSAGAIKTATSVLAGVGAVATGIHLGWESYKEHPDFWTDLSESVFNGSTSPDTPLEVIARAHAGGYTTAMKEKQIAKIIQGLAETGAFDYRSYESEITEPGLQDLTFDEVSPAGQASALAYDKAKELMPGCRVLTIQEDYPNSSHPEIINSVVTYADPSVLPAQGVVTANTSATGKTYYSANVDNTYAVMVAYNTQTSTATYTTYGRTTRAVNSGYLDLSTTRYQIGGLNVDIEIIDADNDLFPNDHSSSNLMLAPDASMTDIIEQLRTKFTDWYNDSWTQDEYDPETGTINSERYYPVTIPWWDPTIDTTKDPNFDADEAQKGDLKPSTDPLSQTQGQTATKNNSKYSTDPALEPTVPIPTPSDTPSDPGAGGGSGASGLWAVYNPTVTELNALGAYLWTNNIIELLEKFLQNPMDAIISLHRLYATPSTGSKKHIILGYLDSGVEADEVTNQFTTVNCGSVTVPEFFGDARDYDAPYTLVEAYLPFIGIVRLRTEDIIGSTVNIVYEVDVYSGACLCKVFVTKLGATQQLYTYSGNCSMQIPLTGGDRTRLLSGALTGAVAGATVGGPVGAVVGAVGGAFKGGSSVDRCGGFSANAACMGIKKPYLIITRKYAYDAGAYNEFYGYPSNVTVQLSTCHGFTRVKSLHIETIGRATDSEKSEIETLLKQGVIIK